MWPLQQRPSRQAAVGSETEALSQRCRPWQAARRQPTGRCPSGGFDPELQPVGATKTLGLGLGRGDEQVEWGAARAARWLERARLMG
eukprot:COSAG06_NODE_1560_length_9104_cov_82.958468_7_plen_87_part_00